MPKLKVDIQTVLPEFAGLVKNKNLGLLLANTERAVEKLSTMYQETWVNAAMGASLPGLPFVISSKHYQRTIKRTQTGALTWEISSDYTTKSGRGVTDLLEAGHGLIDLKPGLLNGPKSRMGKHGRYNVVSFRHGSPNSDNAPMPLSVYKSFTAEVKKADAMKKAGAATRGGTSVTTQASAVPSGRSYSWGSKYDVKSAYGQRSKLITQKSKRVGTYTQKAGKYAGMVRLQQSTTKSNRGGYFTFRIVSAASDPMSWIVPEQEPWPIRQSVVDFMRPFAEGILKEALEADIK